MYIRLLCESHTDELVVLALFLLLQNVNHVLYMYIECVCVWGGGSIDFVQGVCLISYLFHC